MRARALDTLRWLLALAVMGVLAAAVVPLIIDSLSGSVQLSGDESSDVTLSPSPTASPSPSVAETSASPSPSPTEDDIDRPDTYTVVSGDTGAEIAEEFYDDPSYWPDLARANDMAPGAPLRVGQELELPDDLIEEPGT